MWYFYGTVNYINIMKTSIALIFITSTAIIKRKRDSTDSTIKNETFCLFDESKLF